MSVPTRVLQDHLISADGDTGRLEVLTGRAAMVRWFWKIELDSGTGENTVKVTPKYDANWEDYTATAEEFDFQDSRVLRYPELLTEDMVTNAPSSILRLTVLNWNVHRSIKFDWDYAGTGSRVFKVNLWVG